MRQAKHDELSRIMDILEADFEEKNLLPPREASLGKRLEEGPFLTYHLVRKK